MIIFVCLPGCHFDPAVVEDYPADGEDLPILHQVTGTQSHETLAMQLVIRDPAALSQIPLHDIPVSFPDEMVLIVTLGRVPSDQYAVQIDRVWRDGHQLHVATTVQRPPPNAPVVMASPYCIAVVPRSDLNVADFDPDPPPRKRAWSESPPAQFR